MIDLAYRDIRHSATKFVVTALGVGMLFGIVLLMIGVYRGLIEDARSLCDDVGADLWVVQDNTLGPFGESSRIHSDLEQTLHSIEGIKEISALTLYSTQLPYNGQNLRVFLVGYDPFGSIVPIKDEKLIKGRVIERDRYEMVVSSALGIDLGSKIVMANDEYKVVGIVTSSVSSGGDPLVYVSLKDSQKIQFDYTNETIRNDRARGVLKQDTNIVNAVVATLREGYDDRVVADDIAKWKHLSVYTNDEQLEILLKNVVEKSARQIGLFTAILILVSTVIIGLIIYTMTLEKMKSIAIMKLVGIANYHIIKMIVKETLILGGIAFVCGSIFANLTYKNFPKKMVLELQDASMLFVVILVASVLASLIGVHKVLGANAQSAIGG